MAASTSVLAELFFAYLRSVESNDELTFLI